MNKKIFTRIVFCIIFLSHKFIFSETFTWEKILLETKTKNPTLIKSKQLLDQAEINYKILWSNFLPKITASADVTRSGNNSSSDEITRYSYGVSGRLTLFNGFGDMAQLQIKHIELQIAQEQFKRTYADIIYNVKKSFINLLWAQKNVELAEKIYSRRKDNYELIKLRYEAGREDKGSLLKVEADLLNSEFELKKAYRNKTVYLNQLLKDIGTESLKDIIVEGTFYTDKPDIVTTFLDLAKNTPEYKIAELKLKKSEQEIVYAKSIFYPDLSLSVNISAFGTEFPLNSRNWSSGLELSFPLFSGRKNYYNYLLSEKNKIIQEQSFNETKLQLLSNLESVYNTLIDDYETIKIREKYLQASEEQTKITTLKYLNGLVSYYDWYSVENEYINAQKS
ncbi:MAG: TolC family protein, partial [Endomicrobiia bacterium]